MPQMSNFSYLHSISNFDFYPKTANVKYCSRSSTDRMLACEAGDPSSILGESTT